MPAAKLNLSIEQGATFKHVLKLLQPALPGQTALPVDLGGYSARMQLRAELPSAAAIIELSSSNGRIVLTPATGQLQLQLTASETAALSFEAAVYDLEITSAGGEVIRVLQGNVTLSLEVTR